MNRFQSSLTLDLSTKATISLALMLLVIDLSGIGPTLCLGATVAHEGHSLIGQMHHMMANPDPANRNNQDLSKTSQHHQIQSISIEQPSSNPELSKPAIETQKPAILAPPMNQQVNLAPSPPPVNLDGPKKQETFVQTSRQIVEPPKQNQVHSDHSLGDNGQVNSNSNAGIKFLPRILKGFGFGFGVG